ncbi:MAG: SDR family NAD(P)-dependent oxidoreductase [Paracoccaceae bacterium]
MSDGFSGKVAIVTGAGGAVGRAIAARFVSLGGAAMLTDESEQALGHSVAEMRAPEHRVAKFHTKVQDKLGAANLLAATLDAFERVDILVNIPRATQPGTFAELDGQGFAEALYQNVISSFLLSQAVAKRMVREAEGSEGFEGSIINVSSIAARRTVGRLLAYSVSCAALDQLTRSMAADLAPQVRVNGIALGAVMTERMRLQLREREDLRGELIRVTPLGRIGEAEEAAEAALFLMSSRASFITGQIVTVDGGRSVLDPLASPVR